MIHYHLIGHLDPSDPLDLTRHPSPPKWAAAVDPAVVSRWASRLGVRLGVDVEARDDHLVSRLGYGGVLHPFEAAMVAEGCVVLTEAYAVVQPGAAATRWRHWCRSTAAAHRR